MPFISPLRLEMEIAIIIPFVTKIIYIFNSQFIRENRGHIIDNFTRSTRNFSQSVSHLHC